MFRTKYERKVINTNCGDPVKVDYATELDARKNIKVVPKGSHSLYDFINSFADSVDINVLLARFTNGDKEALMRRAGAYIDISALPTNINDFIDIARNGQSLFDTLPVEVKQQFNNNYVEFISTIGDDSWKEKMQGSADSIKKYNAKKSVDAARIHKEAANVEYNTVYGNQVVSPDPDVTTQPVVNPITGNEVTG